MTLEALLRMTKPMTTAESDAMALRIGVHENASNDCFSPIKHLFLDLEDTIITPVLDGWFKTELINVEKVKAFIAEFQPDFLHLFTFALWNQREKEMFEQGTKPMIEAAFGKLSFTWTVDDEILPNCLKVANIHPSTTDFADMSAFGGKHEAFRLNMRHLFRSGSTPVEVVLLDDAVYNELFEWPDIQVKGRILNIDQMKEHHGINQSRAATISRP